MEMDIQHLKFLLASGLFDDSAEKYCDTYRILIENIDDTYHIGSANLCRALVIIDWVCSPLNSTVKSGYI